MAGEMAYGAQPVYSVGGGNEGGLGGGQGGIWVILLFLLILGGGNGLGGLGGGATAATNQITNEFLFNNLNSSISQGFTQVVNQNFALQKDLWQGFSGMQMQLCEGFHNVDNSLCAGFNGVNQNITQLGFMLKDCCCEIKGVVHSEGEATRALINSNTMQELRDNLQAAQLTLSNANQTQNILNNLGTYEPYGKRCCY